MAQRNNTPEEATTNTELEALQTQVAEQAALIEEQAAQITALESALSQRPAIGVSTTVAAEVADSTPVPARTFELGGQTLRFIAPRFFADGAVVAAADLSDDECRDLASRYPGLVTPA